jgi:DNA-binding response OmpR family regulator
VTSAKILIVDDDEQLQRLLCRRALAVGLSTTALFDGTRVLEVAVEQRPALILLDVGLPGIDGRDVLKALKSEPLTRHIPVFVHTGRSEHSDRIVAFTLGADDYFEKPFDIDMLMRRILRHIERVRASSEEPESSSELAAQPHEVDQQQAEVLRADRQKRLSRGKIPTSLERKSRCILVVEDDNEIRRSVCDILQDEGFATWSAKNGREALDLLYEQPSMPSLILLDLMMPVMDGWQFHERLARDRKIPPIPVVVMSAHARDAMMRSLPWLQKPIRLERLLSTIGELSGG